MNENDKNALNRITKQAAKVTQSELTYIDDLYCDIQSINQSINHFIADK